MPSPSGSPRWLLPVATVAIAALVSGCTLDFDQFDTNGSADASRADTGADTRDAVIRDVPSDANPDPDIRTDRDSTVADGASDLGDTVADTDGSTQPLQIGTTCTEDSQCGSGTCLDGYCTRSCQLDQTSSGCPSSASCTPVGEHAYCLLECSAIDACPSPDGRQLHCLSLQGAPTLDPPATQPKRCLSDADEDHIFDAVDNCPMTENGDQADQNDDGVGNACSTGDPACPSDVSGGLRAYPVLASSASNVSIPSTTTSRWIPVTGGITGPMMPLSNAVHLVDRQDGSATTLNSLPYGLTDQALLDVPGSHGHVGSPGSTLRSKGTQFGRFLDIASTGRVNLGPQYALNAEHVQMAMTGAGIPVAHGYTDSGWHIWRWDPSSRSFQRVTGSATSTGSGDRPWRAVRRLDGDVTFYDRPNPQATGDFNLRVVTVDANANSISADGPVTLPADSSQSSNDAFHPALFPGPGDQLYAIDIRGAARGRIARLDVSGGTADALAPLTFGLDINATAVSVDPGGPSVFLIGDAPGQDNDNFLFIREVYPSCLMGVPQIDNDSDAAPDLLDNCPRTSNSAQADAEGDRIGDTCDPDDDNDGILDGDDLLSQSSGGTDLSADTDNDAIPNGNDSDDDADGIPDARDRHPLDTDNNWIPNNLDTDDDGDGYSDATEQNAGSDPLDPLSFPGAGTVVFTRVTPGGTRTAEIAPLADPSATTTVLDDTNSPHQPRLFNNADGLAALNGAPGSATELVRSLQTDGTWGSPQTISSSSPILDHDVGAVSSTGNDLSTWFTIQNTGSGSTTDPVLSKFSTSNGSFTTLVDSFDVLPVLSADPAGPIQFVAGAARCSGCLSLFTTSTDGSSLSQFDPLDAEPLQLRRSAGWTTLLLPGGAGHPPALLRRPTGSQVDFRTIDTPQVDDIASAISISDDHLLITARRQGHSFDLWWYNARIDDWFKLSDTNSDILGLDWTN
jgi:hypothetical protein